MSDEATQYLSVGTRGYRHESVNHGKKEWAGGDCRTNKIEAF
jgi:hypothetical protein